ncbi:hypothetical protein B0H16DRAFT_1681817 [Mycena metata]|uniref:Uncharacterized protein n=1 Tax=Mycena metata TaxID=1033252 RepID=A0AAD7KGX5_9AGAR|nr:hypothetical protein B0H16DRAFT_1681817 [Mycena metata]
MHTAHLGGATISAGYTIAKSTGKAESGWGWVRGRRAAIQHHPVRQFRTDGRLFVCEIGDEQGDSEGGEKDKEGIKSRKKSQKCAASRRRNVLFSAAQGRIEAARVPVNQQRHSERLEIKYKFAFSVGFAGLERSGTLGRVSGRRNIVKARRRMKQKRVSAKCQKSDWKEHQWNCSVLPVDGVPAATAIEIDEEFKAEVARMVAILTEVATLEEIKDEKAKLTAPMLAPLLKITSELPERLHYKQRIHNSDKFKYRLPLLTACRLILIDYVTSKLDSEARRKQYEAFFKELMMPTHHCELYGPKIVARPADLSSGEYESLGSLMQMFEILGMEDPEAKKEETVAAAEENEPAGMRWIWLAALINRTFDVK